MKQSILKMGQEIPASFLTIRCRWGKILPMKDKITDFYLFFCFWKQQRPLQQNIPGQEYYSSETQGMATASILHCINSL